ncbi:MAG: C4-dicarboxylate ABC transporter substrate-binding protein, partial [bacterium]|nr:C4-dicarboxylate ABC transporter substrate-binding protein [bacterium]
MKRLIGVFVIAAMVITLGFAQAEAKVTLTWSAVSVPDDAHTKAMLAFKAELEKLTDGEVEVEAFHSGQLFNQEAAQAAIRKGTLDMVYTGPNWLAEFVPYMSMFAAAYMFQDYDHMNSTFNGELGKEMFDGI